MTGHPGAWRVVCRCVECDAKMSHVDIFRSMGICPHCGYPTQGTVCDYFITVVRPIRSGPWPWSRIVKWEKR